MIRNERVFVSPLEGGLRLDSFIFGKWPMSTKSFIRIAIADGKVLLNGERPRKGGKVRVGDEVEVLELLEEADNRPKVNPSVEVDVVFEDDYVIGVNKHSGVSVQPLTPYEDLTLVNGMVARYPNLTNVGDEPLIAGAVHRIDGGTSGLVIFAKSNEVFSSLRRAFSERLVEKRYLAMVEGVVKRGGKISGLLVHDRRLSFCKMISVEDCNVVSGMRPMFAETIYRPAAVVGNNTLLDVTIFTGVTHQIRAQLSMLGHPIVGDNLYGARPMNGRHFLLHSYSASFIHPILKLRLVIKTPLPSWASALKGEM